MSNPKAMSSLIGPDAWSILAAKGISNIIGVLPREEEALNASETLSNVTWNDAWPILAAKGVSNAIRGLSEMVGQEITPTSLNVSQVPAKGAADLVGGAEARTVAVYLGVTGSAPGHVLIVYRPETAFELVDMLMETAPGSTTELGEMEQSVLGEVGNIMGSFFMNAVADTLDLNLRVSPPAVMMDMAGAVLDPVLADIMRESDDIMVVEASFGTRDRQVDGTFLVLPSPDLRRTLLQKRDKS